MKFSELTLGHLKVVAVLFLAFMVVIMDSLSRVMSMCVDLVFVAMIIVIVWGPITKGVDMSVFRGGPKDQ